jgi:hypothetical protein
LMVPYIPSVSHLASNVFPLLSEHGRHPSLRLFECLVSLLSASYWHQRHDGTWKVKHSTGAERGCFYESSSTGKRNSKAEPLGAG